MQSARLEREDHGPQVQSEEIVAVEEEKTTPAPELEDITLSDGGPTDEESATLRKVADSLPWSAFLVAAIELCERFAYYGLNGPFQVRRFVYLHGTFKGNITYSL